MRSKTRSRNLVLRQRVEKSLRSELKQLLQIVIENSDIDGFLNMKLSVFCKLVSKDLGRQSENIKRIMLRLNEEGVFNISLNRLTPPFRDYYESSNYKFEVYTATSFDGETLYVGSGSIGRHRHCNSGTSHSYALNKFHFSNKPMIVKVVVMFNTKHDAYEYEKYLISKLQPMYNIVHNKI